MALATLHWKKSTDKFDLKLNTHEADVRTAFQQLLSTNTLLDVTLECEGLEIKAHKIILCAYSSYLHSLLTDNRDRCPTLIFRNISYANLKAIVHFMYTGEVEISNDQLNTLSETAETLKVNGLVEMIKDNKTATGATSANNILTVFKLMLSTESLVDVTVACDGLKLKAHKVVLAACSPYFLEILKKCGDLHPIVMIKDLEYSHLKSIIDFMYSGEISVGQAQFPEFLKRAEMLEVRGLMPKTPETSSAVVQPQPTDTPVQEIDSMLSRNAYHPSRSSCQTDPHPYVSDFTESCKLIEQTITTTPMLGSDTSQSSCSGIGVNTSCSKLTITESQQSTVPDGPQGPDSPKENKLPTKFSEMEKKSEDNKNVKFPEKKMKANEIELKKKETAKNKELADLEHYLFSCSEDEEIPFLSSDNQLPLMKRKQELLDYVHSSKLYRAFLLSGAPPITPPDVNRMETLRQFRAHLCGYRANMILSARNHWQTQSTD